jgi:16S rRNA G966 N2-methylase RsmD
VTAERRRTALSQPAGPIESTGDARTAELLVSALVASTKAPDADRLTHGFHSYPARMHPAIAATLLDAAPRGVPLLDPFCGSGTVLVEAVVRGMRATGVDLNPLALRIAATRCALRGPNERARFVAALRSVADRSLERVRERRPVQAPLPRSEVRWYEPHVLKELGGLREEIAAVAEEADRDALQVLLSAIVVKFSRQRADTAEETAPKRIRKGLATEFFVRKGEELARRWADLDEAAARDARPPVLFEGDARRLARLLPRGAAPAVVVTSPPYGGTYDYVAHHARRYPWLGLDPRRFERFEIGARRALRGPDARARWDAEVRDVLRALSEVVARDARLFLLTGDAQLGRTRIDAAEQLRHLAPAAGLRVLASASQLRPDWSGGPARREHLVALLPR